MSDCLPKLRMAGEASMRGPIRLGICISEHEFTRNWVRCASELLIDSMATYHGARAFTRANL